MVNHVTGGAPVSCSLGPGSLQDNQAPRGWGTSVEPVMPSLALTQGTLERSLSPALNSLGCARGLLTFFD